MKKLSIILIIFSVLILDHKAYAARAVADIKGTAPDSKISGKVDFEDSAEGLKIKAELMNVPAGKHGFHIHENGSCADTGKAAGGHFNPDGVNHGLLSKDGYSHSHAGDLGNIEAAADGTGKLETILPHASLSGKYNLIGRSVILHEKEDDFSQPTGNAGSRIGCGVIQSQT